MKKVLVVLALVIVTVFGGYCFICNNAETSYETTVTDVAHDCTGETNHMVNGHEMSEDEYVNYIQNQ